MLNPHIFRRYDIRGVVGRDLDGTFAEALGRAFATRLIRHADLADRPRVVVGRDNRDTSPALAETLIAGLRASGANVIDVGIVPTPVHSFATVHFDGDAGIQITGSHNPTEYNGFKLTVSGRSLYGDAITELRRLIESEDFESGGGELTHREILPTYIATLTEKFSIDRPLEVVVDCGNGTGSVVAVELLRALDSRLTVIPLFCESDSRFPNHHPDPVVDENLAHLIEKVREAGADLGVAFDGDADRIGAVDDRGRIVRGDTLLALYAQDLLARRGPELPIVFDVKCSQALPEVIQQAGGRPIMSATGHSLIKERMKQEGALLAGELSGHIMFGDDYFGFDDALYAACLLISIVSRTEQPLSALVDAYPQFVSTSELRYPSSDDGKWEIVSRAVDHFSSHHDVIDVDGARVLFGDGWGLLRASNTEPVLVARYEARSPERLREIRDQMEEWVRAQGIRI